MNILIKKTVILLLCVSALSITRAQTIADVFKAMPAELLPGVSEGNKTMLLVDTGKTVVPSLLAEIQKLKQSADFLEIKTSTAGTMQLKLLPVSADSAVVCVIKTVCAKVCDSRMYFYTVNWQKLDVKDYFPLISKEIFFNSSQKNSDKYKYAVSLPDIYPVSAEFADGSNELTLKLDAETYLSAEMYNEVKPFLKTEPVTLKWDNGVFR